jgi:anti-anti-sigma regulatory factor
MDGLTKFGVYRISLPGRAYRPSEKTLIVGTEETRLVHGHETGLLEITGTYQDYNLILDLGRVTQADSTFMGDLLSACGQVDRQQHTITICGVNECVRVLLDRVRFEDKFSVTDKPLEQVLKEEPASIH